MEDRDMKKILIIMMLMGLVSCGGPSKHLVNPGAEVPIYTVPVNDFRDLFPELPRSSAATTTKFGKLEVYLVESDRDETIRQSIHEVMRVQGGYGLKPTLNRLSSKRWDAATCGPIKE